jgi:hypothetical protein
MAGLGMWPSAGIYKMPSINTADPLRKNSDSHIQTRIERRGFANRGEGHKFSKWRPCTDE